MMGVFAEFERAMIQERVKSGLERARAQGKRLGRRPIDARKEAAIRADLREGKAGIMKLAAAHGGRREDGPADQPCTGAQRRLSAGCPPTEIDPKRLWRLTGGPRGLRLPTQRRASDGRPRSPVSLGEASQSERVGNTLRLVVFANRRAVTSSSSPMRRE